MKLLETIGGRKFIVTLGCGAVTSLLQAFGKLDPDGVQFAVVIVGTVGAFILGNVAQKKILGDQDGPT